jgi:transcriptional activator of cad operon
MEHPPAGTLRMGDWCVNPMSGQISRNGETTRVEVRTMRLLMCLAERPGEVVSIDDLLNQVWSGVAVSPDSVYQAVTSLRRLLGDDPKQPAYIETVPRLGYRMVATVSPWIETADPSPIVEPPAEPPPSSTRRKTAIGIAIAVASLLIALLVYKATKKDAATPLLQKSIAVLPFLDLTEKMNEHAFADGMTEELINRLSKIPGLQVPAPRSSFLLKGKKMPIADVAKLLGVAYVLDGSIRKSGARVRVAARLIRADNGYVVWSENYDRPLDDMLMVQDDIAGEVTKALRTSMERPAR